MLQPKSSITMNRQISKEFSHQKLVISYRRRIQSLKEFTISLTILFYLELPTINSIASKDIAEKIVKSSKAS